MGRNFISYNRRCIIISVGNSIMKTSFHKGMFNWATDRMSCVMSVNIREFFKHGYRNNMVTIHAPVNNRISVYAMHRCGWL